MHVRTSIWVSMLAAGLMGAVVQAKVYRAIEVPAGHLNTKGLPWDEAYQTTMQVDGQRMKMRAYSARFGEPVGAQFKNQYEAQGADVKLNQSHNMTRGTAKWDGGEARLLVLSPDSQPNQTVFIFYPEPEEVRPVSFPVAHYPRSRLLNSAGNLESGSTCAFLETSDSADQVLTFYEGLLRSSGWTSSLPEPNRGTMAMYYKKKQVCCVLVSGEPGRPNRVTVLVKDGAL